jgi:hypothetical protein
MQPALSLPDSLDTSLQAHFKRTRNWFTKPNLPSPEAVILGGGYGRGEGGVAVDDAGKPCFFNDLDYFIFTDHPKDQSLLDAVHQWERDESAILGIDVEGKCLPKSDLSATPGSMMFYDLVTAHTQVLGPGNYLAEFKSLARPETIQPIEATRLLWNRGSGLFFARVDLIGRKNLDLVHRNQAKAKLALGDALLTIRGKYRPYVVERQLLLKSEPATNPRIVALHEEGAAFKLKPTKVPSLEKLESTQAELIEIWQTCFLAVESQRLNYDFTDAGSYIEYSKKLFPETATFKNFALTIRDQMKRAGHLSPCFDYPRGALQRALLALLSDSGDLSAVEKSFNRSLPNLSAAAEHYTKWWMHYS